jgi:hypothetical protein
MIDSDLPFVFTSASDGEASGSLKRNFPITNNHINFEISKEAVPKGPFAETHVGGLPHRSVPLNTDDAERPEAYTLSFTDDELTISRVPINAPKSMFFKDISGTRFMNFSNIKHNTDTGIAGNFKYRYEFLQITGRGSNNRYLIDNNADWLSENAVTSTFVDDVVDFEVPERDRAEHVITNRFNAIGGPELSSLTRDRETEEYSVYNSMNYRNLVPRTAQNLLSKEHAEQFGYRSGSSTQGSIHKINRNPLRFVLDSEEAVRYDNEFVTHPIPQSDYQYSWVANSVDDDVYDFLRRNNNMGYVSNFPLKHKEYSRDFSQDTPFLTPSGWSTIASDIDKYVALLDYSNTGSNAIQITASGGLVEPRGADIAAGQKIMVSENRIYKRDSVLENHTLEYSGIQTRFGIDSVAINEDDSLVSVLTRYPHARTYAAASASLDIYRSSSSGWVLETELTGALDSVTSNQIKAHFFSGSSIVFQDGKNLSWFESSSVSGWGTKNTTTFSGFSFGLNNNEVGMPYDTDNGKALAVDLSRVKIIHFNHASSSWEQSGSFYIDLNEGTEGDVRALHYKKDTIFIGRPGTKTSYTGQPSANGTVDIHFVEDGGSTSIESPQKDFADGFGASLSSFTRTYIDHQILAVGSPRYDMTFSDEEQREVENDKGAVFIYMIDRTLATSSWAQHTMTLYDSRPNPPDISFFGQSVAWSNNPVSLLVESPAEGDEARGENSGASTFISRYDFQITRRGDAFDPTTYGPRISGSSSNALLMIGYVMSSPEIPEFPRAFFDRTGDNYRAIQSTTDFLNNQYEFVFDIEIIEGSSDASDTSNSVYGLQYSPSSTDKLLVQHKIGNGNWQNSGILISGNSGTLKTTQNAFKIYTTNVIKNPKLETVALRIITNTSIIEQEFWGIKTVKTRNTTYGVSSSDSLIKNTSFRKETIKKNHFDVDCISFTNPYASQLSANISGVGRSAYYHNLSLYWADALGDNANSLHVWLKPSSFTPPEDNYEVYVVSHTTSDQAPSDTDGWGLLAVHNNGKIAFKFILRNSPAGSHSYYVQTKRFFDVEEWYNVCVTYDGNGASTIGGLKIYVNGVEEEVLSNRETTSYTSLLPLPSPNGWKIVLGYASNTFSYPRSYTGKMKNLMLIEKELTSSEVSSLYERINNISENYSLLDDPLRYKEFYSSFTGLTRAYWSFSSKSRRIETSTGYAIYTTDPTLGNGYELVAEDIQTNTATNWQRVAPIPVTDTLTKIVGTNQLYSTSDYTLLQDETGVDYLKKFLSQYSYPSWQQLRSGDTPVARRQKKDNKLTISVRGDHIFPKPMMSYYHDQNSDLITTPRTTSETSSRQVEVYDEVMLTGKYQPLTITMHTSIDSAITNPPSGEIRIVPQESMKEHWEDNETLSTVFNGDIPLDDSRLVSLRVTTPNDLSMFSNEELNNRLQVDEYKRHNISQILQAMSSLANTENSQLEVSYKETIYPKEVNTYTERARLRTLFDFYSWRDLRNNREITLSGSNSYGTSLVNIGPTKVFPEITVDEYDYRKSNEFFVDSRNVKNRFSSTLETDKLVVSRWPLDARKDFSSTPANLRKSYFNQGDLALVEAEVGERGEGVLQNDYSIFGLGYNGLYGTPPASSLYSRRIPQSSSAGELLAGEAKWQAADQSGRKPYENSGDKTEKLKRLWQDHSLVPEYKVSEYVEDIVLNQKSDFSKVKDKSDFLSVTGAVYHTSSQEVSVGSTFFKTYGTSDFMKYFGMTLEDVKDNGIGGAAHLTLKCNAAIKFTPYRGFYPAERALQIGELFSRGYMPEFSIVDERQTDADREQVTDPEKLMERKIRANMQQSIKPLMAPGVLFNSIKAGMAVDYPIFGSSDDDTALVDFNTAIQEQTSPVTSFLTAGLDSLVNFTGSIINSTEDEGVPRLSGSVSRRVTFEDLLEPQRLVGTKIYDNEPHPSASIYYGDSAVTKVFDYPFEFGQLDADNNQTKVFSSNFTLTKTLDDTLVPYKMAVNNFCAETVNFFLEDGHLASLESDQVNPNLVSGTAYKMRVYVKNNSLTMYDRHSAFGPPVDEGDITFTEISGTSTTNPGKASFAEFGTPSITIGSDGIGTTNFVIEDSAASTITVHIRSGSIGSDITTGVYGPGGGTEYDVSAYGKVYVSSTSSYIDLGEIEATATDSEEALNRLMEVAVNYHRWQGSIDIEANLVDGNIRLRQLTNGTGGDTSITANGNVTSLYPDFPSTFAGGVDASTDFTGVSTSTITVSSSHEYAPFVPPYLDRGAEPYVEITFTPTESRTYSLEEILQEATYEYSNFKDIPSNSATNTNYKNAMSISASLDLTNFVAYKEEASDPGTTLEQRKRWVIQTKWETPVLNFNNVSVDALNLSSSTVEAVTGSPWQSRTWNQYLTKSVLTTPEQYLTASTGMWHQYGALLNSNEGYTISIKEVEGVASDAQLAKKVGFLGEDLKPVSVTPGRIAEKKEISEAVVAIPFYVDEKGDKMKFFTVKNQIVKNATKLNKERRDNFNEVVHGLSKASERYKAEREEYLDFYNNPGATARESIAYQIRMMEKFIFPPQFDYYTYPDLPQKAMMYVFQFNAELTKQDLANIWQNLSPESAKSGATVRSSSVYNAEVNGIRQDVQYVSNFLSKRHMPWSQRKAFFENDVRWLIFKVKQRAENDLANVKMSSLPGSKNNLVIDQARTSIKKSEYLQGKSYSYNWPYDYFSLVELIKVEGKVDFLPFGDDGTK